MKDKRLVVLNLVRSNPHATIAEIGVWKGELAMGLLETVSGIKNYFLVDPFKVEFNDIPEHDYVCDMGEPFKTQEELDLMHDTLKASLPGNAELVRSTSWEAAPFFPAHYFDFVFIDAIHLYNEVKYDIKIWTPKIKPGGILAGDDYGKDIFPGVTKAVDELQDVVTTKEGIWHKRIKERT